MSGRKTVKAVLYSSVRRASNKAWRDLACVDKYVVHIITEDMSSTFFNDIPEVILRELYNGQRLLRQRNETT